MYASTSPVEVGQHLIPLVASPDRDNEWGQSHDRHLSGVGHHPIALMRFRVLLLSDCHARRPHDQEWKRHRYR